jgi:hypothetical protein
VLFVCVNDENRLGEFAEAADPAQVALQLLKFPAVTQRFLLGHRLEVASLLHGFEFLHALHPSRDGLEVGQHAAQPALVHIRHSTGIGIRGNRALCLLFGAHKEDASAPGDQVTGIDVRLLDALHRLSEINQVDPVALTEDEPAHLWVPTAGLVAKVDASTQ